MHTADVLPVEPARQTVLPGPTGPGQTASRAAGPTVFGLASFVLGWLWRIVAGAFLCASYPGSVIVTGWTYRWMQGLVLRGLWRRSPVRGATCFCDFTMTLGPDAPNTRPRWVLQEHIRDAVVLPTRSGDKPGFIRVALRLLYAPWGSLWQNFKVGLQATVCTFLLTGWGCALMAEGL
jgi:hypothetical protein